MSSRIGWKRCGNTYHYFSKQIKNYWFFPPEREKSFFLNFCVETIVAAFKHIEKRFYWEIFKFLHSLIHFPLKKYFFFWSELELVKQDGKYHRHSLAVNTERRSVNVEAITFQFSIHTWQSIFQFQASQQTICRMCRFDLPSFFEFDLF